MAILWDEAPGPADPELVQLLARARDRHDDRRAEAVRSLGAIDHPLAVEALAELLGDPDVALEAAAALERLGRRPGARRPRRPVTCVANRERPDFISV